MNLPIKLDSNNLGTLIYIIVVALWVIGNVLSKSKKGKRRTSIPRPDESSTEKELREFLETISGKPTIQPEEVVKPPPKPAKVRTRQPINTAPSPVRAPTASSSIVETTEAALPTHMRELSPISSFSKTLNSRGSQWKMPGLSMTALRYALSTNRPVPQVPILETKTMRNKNELRRLVSGKIILGPPRAFDPYDGVGDYRNQG